MWLSTWATVVDAWGRITLVSAFNKLHYGSVYSYNFQQIVVRIAANLILTTNNITN